MSERTDYDYMSDTYGDENIVQTDDGRWILKTQSQPTLTPPLQQPAASITLQEPQQENIITSTPQPLQNPISDVFVDQQASYEAGRLSAERFAQELIQGKTLLQEANLNPEKYDPASVSELQAWVDTGSAKLSSYNESLSSYGSQLEKSLTYYKSYGGLTDAGMARLETIEGASVYASALKARGITATEIESSGLSDLVKKQYASLGGLTAAGEEHLNRLALEEYSRYGGLTEAGLAMVSQPEYIKNVIEPADEARGYDVMKSTMLSGGVATLSSESMIKGAERYLGEVGGPTLAGLAMVSQPEYIKNVIEPADEARGYDVMKSTMLSGGVPTHSRLHHIITT